MIRLTDEQWERIRDHFPLAHGRYCDCPHSQPPLAAEDNLNPECAEEGLRPAQPASKCARAHGRPSAMGASKGIALQEARAAASHPTHIWNLLAANGITEAQLGAPRAQYNGKDGAALATLLLSFKLLLAR